MKREMHLKIDIESNLGWEILAEFFRVMAAWRDGDIEKE